MHIELRDEGDKVLVRVEDAGIGGISPEYQAHIFERFGRAVSERHYWGLGAGLYVTRQTSRRTAAKSTCAASRGVAATSSHPPRREPT